jgi:hypothetical protein
MSRAEILLVVILMCVLGIACATAPKKFSFNPVVTIEADYDAIWAAVVEYFAIGNLPIDTIEKDSGLIVTSWMDAGAGMAEDKRLCDCGGAGLASVYWSRGKFSVFVKKLDGGKADLRVTCTFQQKRKFMDAWNTVNCSSTGFLESRIHEYVKAKTTGAQLPEVPTFTPGATD